METKVFDQKYTSLNPRQKEAVDTIYGPVMVIAGPGTGKTTVLTLRIANILKSTDAKPDEILALTFTDSGVRAMREKLREIIGDTSFRVNIFTFHGFANYMRTLYPECFRKIGGRQPATEADQIEIIEEILGSSSFKELRVSTFGVKVCEIVKRISDLKQEVIDPKQLLKLIKAEEQEIKTWEKGIEKMNKTREAEIERKQKYIQRLKEFAKVFSLYEEELEKRELYDYVDTILGLIDALRENPDIGSEMRETFQFILADEHQDANGAQNEILRFFKDTDTLDDPNLFIVGDDKQSIFRFQGANLENFYAFEKEFPQAKKIDLEDNYRSQKTILEGAHALISNDGRIHTKLKSNAKHSEQHMLVHEFESIRDEFQVTARDIEKKLKAEPAATIAVLSRNNTTLHEFSKYLLALEIPYSISGEQSLFENFEYEKFAAFFEALLNPLESPRLSETLYYGLVQISLHDALTLESAARRHRKTLGNVLLKANLSEFEFEDEEAVNKARNIIVDLAKQARTKPLLQFLHTLSESIPLSLSADAIGVLRQLFEEAQNVVLKQRSATLSDFFEYLSRLERHGISPIISNPDRQANVTLSSIHRSKGLEYDFVYVIDSTEKRFEKNGKRNDLLRIPGIGVERDLDEERRLLYVAVTRARKLVTLSYALSGLRDESSTPTAFIDEIAPQYIERGFKTNEEPIDIFKHTAGFKDHSKEILRQTILLRPFSVTALNNYIECPWKYFFRNLLLIPETPEFSAMLGTACHKALERFHREAKKGEIPTGKKLTEIIEQSVCAEAFAKQDLSLALEKAKENINAYVTHFSIDDRKMHIEESLSVPCTVRNSKQFEVLLTGKIDLALEDATGIEVIDFKSKKRVSRNEILGETKTSNGNLIRQLRFYKFLWEKAKPKDMVKNATLVFLTPERGVVTRETFEISEEEKDEIEALVLSTLSEIYELSFLERRCDDTECDYCRLSKMVEFK